MKLLMVRALCLLLAVLIALPPQAVLAGPGGPSRRCLPADPTSGQPPKATGDGASGQGVLTLETFSKAQPGTIPSIKLSKEQFAALHAKLAARESTTPLTLAEFNALVGNVPAGDVKSVQFSKRAAATIDQAPVGKLKTESIVGLATHVLTFVVVNLGTAIGTGAASLVSIWNSEFDSETQDFFGCEWSSSESAGKAGFELVRDPKGFVSVVKSRKASPGGMKDLAE